MSGLFGSTTIKGTRITDFTQTSASVGTPIPFGYGRFVATGNVVFAALPPKETRTVKRQGKGGVKQETFTYSMSYAIGFSIGPIFGYYWIKRNGKVVYTQDPNVPIEDKEYATKWSANVQFYFGERSQLPSSIIESYKGTGKVSAMKHLAYIVPDQDDVTNEGGSVPSYEACVIATPPEAYLTTHPYSPRPDDSMQLEMAFLSASTRAFQWQHQQPPEELVLDIAFDSASTRDISHRYDDEEELQLQLAFVSASTKHILVTHSNPPESIEFDLAFVSASTSVP